MLPVLPLTKIRDDDYTKVKKLIKSGAVPDDENPTVELLWRGAIFNDCTSCFDIF
jgi:hypothetical protein